MGQKGWTDRDCRDLLIFIEWIINLKDQELREEYTSFDGETEETRMRFKLLSTDHILNEGITIGEQRGITIGEQRGITIGEQRGRQEERRLIMDRLIASGMAPSQAASLTGVSACSASGANY